LNEVQRRDVCCYLRWYIGVSYERTHEHRQGVHVPSRDQERRIYDIEGLMDIGLMPWLLCSSEGNGCVKVPRVRSTTLPSMSDSSYGRNSLPKDPGIEIDTNDNRHATNNIAHLLCLGYFLLFLVYTILVRIVDANSRVYVKPLNTLLLECRPSSMSSVHPDLETLTHRLQRSSWPYRGCVIWVNR
jgi:hypothetical protein